MQEPSGKNAPPVSRPATTLPAPGPPPGMAVVGQTESRTMHNEDVDSLLRLLRFAETRLRDPATDPYLVQALATLYGATASALQRHGIAVAGGVGHA